MADEFGPKDPNEPKQGENLNATDKPAARKYDVWRGIGLALLLHMIQLPLVAVTAGLSLAFVGLSQLVYIIPAIIVYKGQGRPGLIKGLIIAASITFLLNATCTALLFASLGNMH